MARIPQAIQKEITQGLGNVNVQIKLAYIGVDKEYRSQGSGDKGKVFENHRRVSLTIIEEDANRQVNDVLVYNIPGASIIQFPKDGSQTLAIVAIIGKNKYAEACVVLSFIDPDFAETRRPKEKTPGVKTPETPKLRLLNGSE